MGVIRLLDTKDAPYMYEWMQDPEITQWLSFNTNDKTLHDAQLFIAQAMLTDKVNRHFAIHDEHDEYVGTSSLKNINHKDNTAEYAIVIRKKYHGQGYAKKASEWLLIEAKHRFDLKTIYLTVMEQNKAAIALYEKLGFIREVNKDSVLVKNNEEITQYYYEKRLG